MRALAVASQPSRGNEQAAVSRYFDGASAYWRDVYEKDGVQSEVYRCRQEHVLALVDALDLPEGSLVLDAGCGAGRLAVELAARGLRVEAVDASAQMVDRAREAVASRRLGAAVAVRQASVYRLPYRSGQFLATIAVGVLPWLDDPEAAIGELARVTRAGGSVIVTADNRQRLNAALDPWLNLRLQPLKRRLRLRAAAAGLLRPPPAVDARLDPPAVVDALLRRSGCAPVGGVTVGFGPFTLLRRSILPSPLGVRLHRRLQRLAEAGRWGLAGRGAHYLVVAERWGGG